MQNRLLSPSEKVAKHEHAFAETSTRLARLEYLQALKKMKMKNDGILSATDVTSSITKSIDVDVLS